MRSREKFMNLYREIHSIVNQLKLWWAVADVVGLDILGWYSFIYSLICRNHKDAYTWTFWTRLRCRPGWSLQELNIAYSLSLPDDWWHLSQLTDKNQLMNWTSKLMYKSSLMYMSLASSFDRIIMHIYLKVFIILYSQFPTSSVYTLREIVFFVETPPSSTRQGKSLPRAIKKTLIQQKNSRQNKGLLRAFLGRQTAVLPTAKKSSR
jgi:hypothetical protein